MSEMKIRSKKGASCRRLIWIQNGGLSSHERHKVMSLLHYACSAAVGNSLAFWTNLPVHELPNISTTIRGSQFGEFVKGMFVQNANELPTDGAQPNKTLWTARFDESRLSRVETCLTIPPLAR
jgi:hypothetical protein